ncbi:MAG TPA: glycoside hydrolase family 6 protein [Thermoleophilaceae bacterium]|nr:glycoside hydrolase family 6 protein [Thermoleophilaceae bacterium]
MRRTRFALLTLVFMLALPAAASAQLPYVPGPLVDPGLVTPPASVPSGPVGEYPEDWAKCVAQTNPTWPTAPPGIDPRGVDPAAPNPLLGQRFFLDRMEPAYIQWVKWMRTGQTQKANTLWKLAREPRFRWFGKFTAPRMEKKIQGYLDRVQCDQPGTVPLMVVMRHQGKGCSGTYRAGGVAEDRRTMKWYDDFARTVGDARVVIAFEPDSLGTVDCLARDRRQARLNVLRYGVNVLSQLPNATIYLEAGASDWEPAARTAKQLRYIGINKVRGFMLNVTHHDWTRNNIQHGVELSRMVGGKHFIINTSYNGRGPLHYKKWINKAQHKWRRINVWCHPGLRGLGPAPTTQTANPLVDAYMYINRPGYSAGSCNGGPLPVGTWWPERALMYAQYATDWLSPPPGTKYGHFKHYSLRQLGAFG